LTSCQKRLTHPLAGGITTIQAMRGGIYPPIWWKTTELLYVDDPLLVPRVSFQHLLRDPASPELAEQFSRQEHFRQLLIRKAAQPLPRIRQRLTRYVGEALQYEAAHLDADLVETLFSGTRKGRHSLTGTALLSLALTPRQKEIVFWLARHPLLDLLTLQTLVRPGADDREVRLMQRHLARLFRLRLVEVKVWPAGKTPLEQQRYLLTSSALRFVATHNGEPFSAYLVPPKYQKSEDIVFRQWGVAGLFHQMDHTNDLYTCLRKVLQGAHIRGEIISDWRSAHEAALSYKDSFTQESEKARPDAELVFAPAAGEEERAILLEYDRGTTDLGHYERKFRAYLDYQLAEGTVLPPILVITPSRKAAQMMRQVLNELGGPSQVLIALERDLLTQGLAAVLRHPS